MAGLAEQKVVGEEHKEKVRMRSVGSCDPWGWREQLSRGMQTQQRRALTAEPEGFGVPGFRVLRDKEE